MFRLFALTCLLASASAFAPARVARRSVVSMAEKSAAIPFVDKPVNLNGELAGDIGFDPFRFSDNGDLEKFREAELKHGRVAMLAATGILFQEVARLGDAFPSKNCFEALKTAPTLGILQIFFVLGALEARNAGYVGRVPGDRGFDPLNLSENGINEKWALMELKHGRLAMWAVAGMFAQTLVDPDTPIIEQTLNWARQFL